MKKSEMDKLREKVFDVEEERRKLSFEIKSQDKKIEELSKQIEELCKQNDELEQKLETMEADLRSAEEEAKECRTDYEELRDLTADFTGDTPNRSSLDTSTLRNLLKYEALEAQWDDIKLEDIEAIIKK